jgi:NTE family protein
MRALVISGGGASGAWSTGAVKYLSEMGIQHDAVCGVSVGAINCSHIAQYPIAQEKEAVNSLVEFWSRVRDCDVKKNWWFGYLSSLWQGAIYNNSPLRNYLSKNLDFNKIKNSDRKLTVEAVCLNTGDITVFRETEKDLLPCIMASCAFPLGFAPEVINGLQYLDGGLKNSIGISSAIDLGADIIDVIISAPEKTSDVYNNSNNIDFISPMSLLSLHRAALALLKAVFYRQATTHRLAILQELLPLVSFTKKELLIKTKLYSIIMNSNIYN